MKIVQKFTVLTGIVLAAFGLSAHAADATNASPKIRIATVNIERVLQQSPRVAALSKKLEGDFRDRQKQINEQQKRLEDAMEKFKKESPTMSQKEREAAEKKITADRDDLVRKFTTSQQDFQKEQNRITQSVLGDITTIVSNIAKKQNYNLVLQYQAVVFPGDAEDITKEVSAEFNKK